MNGEGPPNDPTERGRPESIAGERKEAPEELGDTRVREAIAESVAVLLTFLQQNQEEVAGGAQMLDLASTGLEAEGKSLPEEMQGYFDKPISDETDESLERLKFARELTPRELEAQIIRKWNEGDALPALAALALGSTYSHTVRSVEHGMQFDELFGSERRADSAGERGRPPDASRGLQGMTEQQEVALRHAAERFGGVSLDAGPRDFYEWLRGELELARDVRDRGEQREDMMLDAAAYERVLDGRGSSHDWEPVRDKLEEEVLEAEHDVEGALVHVLADEAGPDAGDSEVRGELLSVTQTLIRLDRFRTLAADLGARAV